MAVYTLEEYAKVKKKKKNEIENAIAYEDQDEINSRRVITLEENAKNKGIDLDDFKNNISDIAPVKTFIEICNYYNFIYSL